MGGDFLRSHLLSFLPLMYARIEHVFAFSQHSQRAFRGRYPELAAISLRNLLVEKTTFIF